MYNIFAMEILMIFLNMKLSKKKKLNFLFIMIYFISCIFEQKVKILFENFNCYKIYFQKQIFRT